MKRVVADWVLSGSSPRVRGKPMAASRAILDTRLIPARAGKTRMRVVREVPGGAHPRACGENAPAGRGLVDRLGSSPRVRGKHPQPIGPHDEEGLIPARAGKTGGDDGLGGLRWAHPRACGENLAPVLPTIADLGSSPRVRGKRVRDAPPGYGGGLIPARAGKTARRRCQCAT